MTTIDILIIIISISIQFTPRNVAVLYFGKSETASGVSFAVPPPYSDSLLFAHTNCHRILDHILDHKPPLVMVLIFEVGISLH